MTSSSPVSFSPKQMKVMCWWHENSPFHGRDAIICDGAVRSGKTFCMSLSFVLWASVCFDSSSFAMCGKTIASVRRNVIVPLTATLKNLGFEVNEKFSRNLIEISACGHTNRFYLFGGRDESSASLIQGITLSGVMLDEAALMPRSFVEQAIARCSVEGSKLWFSCNPDHPMHWFHEEWIKKTEQKNALYLHFTMYDNPSLTPSIINRYKKLYSGAFYERFVEGKWTAAQGCVYPMFSEKIHVKTPPEGITADRDTDAFVLTAHINVKANLCPAASCSVQFASFMDKTLLCGSHIRNADIHLNESQQAFLSEPFACGTYFGNGASTRTFSLGFRPEAVLIFPQGTADISMCAAVSGDGSMGEAELTETGFRVKNTSASILNEAGYDYFYIAMR